jgi:hypothetical protein
MRLLTSTFAIFGPLLLSGAVADADTINLRSGDVVQGTYLGGTARQIRVDVNGNIQTYDIGQVQSVIFTDPNYQQAPPPPPQSAGYPRSGYSSGGDRYATGNSNSAPPPAAPLGVTVPPDTNVTVRMIDSVNSQTARLGQTFRASVDEPIFVNGQQVIPRGADVLTKLVEDQQSGKIEGRTVLTMALVSITINGQPVPVTSSDVKTESSSRGARSAGVIGGGTALGAIVGALAGGGKGAAIGAASGATLGAGTEILTKGQTVKIPSETRLTFKLQTPIQL